MRFLKFTEFEGWYEELNIKLKALVDARLYRIEEHSHFGDTRYLGDGVAELRWKNGLRVYFAKGTNAQGQIVYLILGGTKHGQNKDIQKAKLLLRNHEDHKG